MKQLDIKSTVRSKLDDKQMGILMMLISALSFSFMGVAVKLAADVPIYEKVFFRNFFSIFFAYQLVKKNKASFFGKPSSRLLLTMRSIFGVGGVLTMFYALSMIDVATAVTIQKFSQFWVLILAGFFLKEKIMPKQYLYLILGLLGVIIVSKPSTPEILMPTMICFLSSIFAGIAYTILSKLRTYEHPTTIVFYFSLFSTVVMLVPMVLTFKMFSFYEFILLLITGLSAMGGQIAMTTSYHYAKASDVSIYAYMNIVFSAIISLFVWGALPDVLSILGIGIIVLASYLNFVYVRRQSTLA